jgi:Ca-activated chloride channel homolog
MRFAYPIYLHVLWLVPLFGLFFLWAARIYRRDLARFGQPELLAKLMRSVSLRRRRFKIALWLLAIMCLGLALARPQVSTHAVPVKAEGIDLVFALDTSASMFAEDIQPNRLKRAKHEIAALMDKLRGDRVGIVAFAGASFIQCPLTFDYSATKLFLDAVDVNTISVPGTALADALQTSIRAFEKSPPEASKVIILLTDGEGHTGDPLKVAEEAEKRGIKVYAIGIGSQKGEPIPMRNAQGDLMGYKKDRDGNVVLSKLDQVTLEKIAVLTDGQFYQVSSGGIELEKIYGEIAAMAKTLRDTRLVMHYAELYQYFVGAALGLLVLETAISDRRKARHVWGGRFQ